MRKKVFNISISLILIAFSFFYTNKVIKISREKDPIMLEIIKYNDTLNYKASEAILINNNIIPGINGEKIDIDKSYSNMKKIGKFDKNLIVFNEVAPKQSIKNNFKNYIISGNKTKNYVSLIVELKDTSYVEEILSVLNKKNVVATFFVDKEIFDNSIDLIKLIKSFGNDVELLSSKYSIYEVNKYNSILKLISEDNLSFCINQEKNDELLKSCETSKLYTIVPTIKSFNYLYNSVKHNLENGAIISVTNNISTLKELPSTINYINQKGKKIVLLKKLLEE